MEPESSGDGVGSADEPLRAEEITAPALPSASEKPRARLVTVQPEPRNAWLWIWIRPRAVIRAKIDRGPTWGMWGIPIAAGIGAMLDYASGFDAGDHWSTRTIVLFCVTIGALSPIAATWIGSWLFGVVGRNFGGRGTSLDLRIASCWSSIPGLRDGFSFLAAWLIVGPRVFTSDWSSIEAVSWAAPALMGVVVATLVAMAWGLVIAVKAVAEAHRFSWRRSSLTIFCVGVLVTGAFAVVRAVRDQLEPTDTPTLLNLPSATVQ